MKLPLPVRTGLAAVALALLVSLYGANATLGWIVLGAVAVVLVWRAHAASKTALPKNSPLS